jgi:hypothetical protein
MVAIGKAMKTAVLTAARGVLDGASKPDGLARLSACLLPRLRR